MGDGKKLGLIAARGFQELYVFLLVIFMLLFMVTDLLPVSPWFGLK
jgi:hypothetical protein